MRSFWRILRANHGSVSAKWTTTPGCLPSPGTTIQVQRSEAEFTPHHFLGSDFQPQAPARVASPSDDLGRLTRAPEDHMDSVNEQDGNIQLGYVPSPRVVCGI